MLGVVVGATVGVAAAAVAESAAAADSSTSLSTFRVLGLAGECAEKTIVPVVGSPEGA